MKTISYRQAEGLAIVTLNTPPLNLVSLEMTQELSDLLAKLEADPSVRGLLVTGSGQKAFCAGSDIKEFDDYMVPGAVIEKKLARENAMYTQLANSEPRQSRLFRVWPSGADWNWLCVATSSSPPSRRGSHYRKSNSGFFRVVAAP
jgi:hypothetical protein